MNADAPKLDDQGGQAVALLHPQVRNVPDHGPAAADRGEHGQRRHHVGHIAEIEGERAFPKIPPGDPDPAAQCLDLRTERLQNGQQAGVPLQRPGIDVFDPHRFPAEGGRQEEIGGGGKVPFDRAGDPPVCLPSPHAVPAGPADGGLDAEVPHGADRHVHVGL